MVFIIRGSSTAIDVVVWDRRVVYLKERVVDVQARRRSDRNFNLEFSLPLRIFFFFFFLSHITLARSSFLPATFSPSLSHTVREIDTFFPSPPPFFLSKIAPKTFRN